MEKIVQTAGRTALGEFAPEFAHYNGDVATNLPPLNTKNVSASHSNG